MSDQAQIAVEHDALLGLIGELTAKEYERASDAAESGKKLKDFIEETNLNSQAVSWCKSIVKKLPKKDGEVKAMDVIRSLEVCLPMVKAHVEGQGTQEMDLGPTPDEDESNGTPISGDGPEGFDSEEVAAE